MDPRLDQWIAENIFNHSVQEGSFIGPGIFERCEVPNYTSDLNEAIEIIPYLLKTYEDEWVGISLDYSQGLWRLGEEGPITEDSPAKAICLAAYKLKTGCDWEG